MWPLPMETAEDGIYEELDQKVYEKSFQSLEDNPSN